MIDTPTSRRLRLAEGRVVQALAVVDVSIIRLSVMPGSRDVIDALLDVRRELTRQPDGT